VTAPTDLAKRLRERAEGCEFATDLSLMHQAADLLDRLAAEREPEGYLDALEVLCRVFEDGADARHDKWLDWYDPTKWLHPSRSLGAFISLELVPEREACARLAGVEAQCGEYLTQARVAEQMRQAATAELVEARRVLGENDVLLGSGCNAAQPDAIRELQRAEAIADAAREDTALLNAGQSLMNCADFDYGERHEAILCLTIPKGVGVSGDLRQFLRAALLAAVGKGAQDG
jgi:hypothetical protein